VAPNFELGLEHLAVRFPMLGTPDRRSPWSGGSQRLLAANPSKLLLVPKKKEKLKA
jgi:hypothetical protein